MFGRVADNAMKIVSNSNNRIKVTQIRWLSCVETGKFYRSIVVYLMEKKNTDLLIAKGLIEVEGETAYIEKFQEQSREKS